MQNLRARPYDPANGRFIGLDPFAGNMQDPQSLHKYAYVHGDPIQGVDPTGKWTTVSVVVSLAIINVAVGTYFGVIPAVERSFDELDKSAAIGRGGKDITQQMKRLNSHFDQKWNTLHVSVKDDIMDVNGGLFDGSQWGGSNPFALNVKGVGSWDASQLGSPLMQQDFSVGPDWIPRSVTVDGRAYLAHEVNYFYYGYLNGLAWKDANVSGHDLQGVRSNIAIYRPAGYVFFNVPERRKFDGSMGGRIAWAEAGWKSAVRGEFVTPGEAHSFKRVTSKTTEAFGGSIQFIARGVFNVITVDSRMSP